MTLAQAHLRVGPWRRGRRRRRRRRGRRRCARARQPVSRETPLHGITPLLVPGLALAHAAGDAMLLCCTRAIELQPPGPLAAGAADRRRSVAAGGGAAWVASAAAAGGVNGRRRRRARSAGRSSRKLRAVAAVHALSGSAVSRLWTRRSGTPTPDPPLAARGRTGSSRCASWPRSGRPSGRRRAARGRTRTAAQSRPRGAGTVPSGTRHRAASSRCAARRRRSARRAPAAAGAAAAAAGAACVRARRPRRAAAAAAVASEVSPMMAALLSPRNVLASYRRPPPSTSVGCRMAYGRPTFPERGPGGGGGGAAAVDARARFVGEHEPASRARRRRRTTLRGFASRRHRRTASKAKDAASARGSSGGGASAASALAAAPVLSRRAPPPRGRAARARERRPPLWDALPDLSRPGSVCDRPADRYNPLFPNQRTPRDTDFGAGGVLKRVTASNATATGEALGPGTYTPRPELLAVHSPRVRIQGRPNAHSRREPTPAPGDHTHEAPRSARGASASTGAGRAASSRASPPRRRRPPRGPRRVDGAGRRSCAPGSGAGPRGDGHPRRQGRAKGERRRRRRRRRAAPAAQRRSETGKMRASAGHPRTTISVSSPRSSAATPPRGKGRISSLTPLSRISPAMESSGGLTSGHSTHLHAGVARGPFIHRMFTTSLTCETSLSS